MNTEDQIQAKGLTAPRVTPADLAANIVHEAYFTAADGVAGSNSAVALADTLGESAHGKVSQHIAQPLNLLTFCVLVLRNGFTVTGESACVSSENFDAQIGRDVARKNAVEKIWPLMGYALKERKSNAETE